MKKENTQLPSNQRNNKRDHFENTLNNFLISNGADKQLSELIMFLANQAKTIKKEFFRDKIENHITHITKNVFDEDQTNLDKYADKLFVNGLKKKKITRYIATEEQGQILEINNPKTDYGIVIDPIDGSSLIDMNLTIGSIFGIYPGKVLEKGSKMIAAFYILYGPSTTLTLTLGEGVSEFVMDGNGKFNLISGDLKIPDGKIYSPGALRRDYLPAHERWVQFLEKEGYTLRYSGSFVADVHQILHKGGVFAYPGIKGNEKGKLRLLYEANPMGMIIANAGGAISNGFLNILDIVPKGITDKTPVYIGGKKEIHLIEKFMREQNNPQTASQ
jgi:fructose-1,6-bisphosphatase I